MIFRLSVVMMPLVVGRRLLYAYSYLVRKEPEIVLTAVCNSIVVPIFPNALSDLRPRPFRLANQADVVSFVFRE